MNLTTTGFASIVALGSVCGCSVPGGKLLPEDRYNVLFITVDDMRDYVGFLDGYQGKVYTPNMDRLASEGVAFSNAHTASTVCCPSRNAMLTGRRPSTTGLYDNNQWWKAVYPEMMTLPRYFRNNGYHTAGAGKIFHHTPGNNPPCNWDEYQDQVFDDPWVFAEWSPERYWLNYGYRGPVVPFPEWKPLHGIPGLGPEMDWGAIPGKKEEDYGDVQIVSFAREFLKQEHDKPFFLALGTYRPHIPWHVPQRFYDMYPLDSVMLPEKLEGDLDDVPRAGRKLALTGKDYEIIRDAGKLKEALQAYLASISFADEQVGAILDLLKKSGYEENTIVVFWSDHGWHFGTKEHWHKRTLWEECTRIPFIINAPGITGSNSICHRPVDMVSVFPTLVSLCNLPVLEDLDGHDLSPLLKDPSADWSYPAITELGPGNVAIRTQNWRYIRYHDGTEELYDRINDPNEWHNYATDDEYLDIICEHRQWVPESVAEPVPGKESYFFDPYSYTFMHRQTGAFIDGKR